MKFVATVYTNAISKNHPKFDKTRDISLEELSSPAFRTKMLNLPMHLRHHDTQRAGDLIVQHKLPLSRSTMARALDYMSKSRPRKFDMAMNSADLKNINFSKLQSHMSANDENAPGQGVIGKVKDFWQNPKNQNWNVYFELEWSKVWPFLHQITPGGNFGEVSLSHDPDSYEPIELSLVNKGMRNGCTISPVNKSIDYKQVPIPFVTMANESIPPVLPSEEEQREKFNKLYKETPETIREQWMQTLQTFIDHEKTEIASGAEESTKKRIKELEDGYKTFIEMTNSASVDLEGLFGKTETKTEEQWMENPGALAERSKMYMAGAIQQLKKRKAEPEMDPFDMLRPKSRAKQLNTVVDRANLVQADARHAPPVAEENLSCDAWAALMRSRSKD